MFRLKTMIAAAAAVCAAAAAGADSAAAKAMHAGKGLLVLQTGSDWCVSGEAVRKVFESREFAKACPSYALAVYDEADEPTPAIQAANSAVSDVLVRTKRFPAIACYAPYGGKMRFFAQMENVPANVTASRLAAAVSKLAARKDAAVKLFERARNAKDAADSIGAGFDILAPLAGQFHFSELSTGRCAWDGEWKKLVSLDEGDSLGWVKHFTMDDLASVKMVDAARRSGGRGALEALKRIPDAHFTPAQKQVAKIMEFALSSPGSGAPLKPGEKKLLEETLALERDSFWGQFALGRLMMSGEKYETRPPRRAQPKPRAGQTSAASKPQYPFEKASRALASLKPGDAPDAQACLAIARHAVLRLAGEKAWNEAASRPGGAKFLKAFMNDRTWLEDFAWSGTFPGASNAAAPSTCDDGAGAGALLALESLVFQDGGEWVPYADGKYEDNEGRRFMTALAIGYPDKDEAWLADVLDAYRATAKAGRLHKSAYSQPVWLWRFALHQGHATAGADDMAAQQRHLDRFVNLPRKEYGGACWMIEYRLENCFGDSVHTPLYYKAWATAGEWPKRKYSQIVGGVCGELSKFGSACSNAHGLPSTTAGQPGHCAYTRRLPGGKWEIDYSVTGHTQAHLTFWNKSPWQYLGAFEGTFSPPREKRLAAERRIELARAAIARGDRKDKVEPFFRQACKACPTHYGAWHAYGGWIAQSGASVDEEKVWVRGCARGMRFGRQPLWDFLTPYFARVASGKGKAALADALVEFAPLLKQSADVLQEEADFSVPLAEWTKPLAGDLELERRVLEAMLLSQFGTKDFFAQTLGWGCDAVMKSEGGTDAFMKTLENVMAAKSAKTGGGGIDFDPLLLSASKQRNMEAFRRFAALQDRFSPPPQQGRRAASDFGGALVSSGGMLVTSSTSSWDSPGKYPACIDARNVQGNSFHTAKEQSPWAEVVLQGPVDVLGVVVENNSSPQNRSRQVPLEVQTSEDGREWKTVYTDSETREMYRIDLRRSPVRARAVRVRRAPDAKNEVFHLGKILVYGRKLY